MLGNTLYDILGVDENASAEKIRQAWRRLVRENHKDEDKLKRINTAFNELKNPEKRQAYDKYLVDLAQVAAEQEALTETSPKTKINSILVDSMVRDFLGLHDPSINLDVDQFFDLLKHSLSLDADEKKRIIDSAAFLSQNQFDRLTETLMEEREKFRELIIDNPRDVNLLVRLRTKEWITIGEMYFDEFERLQRLYE